MLLLLFLYVCISLAGRYRSHAPEKYIIFGSPKGSIYQICMFPARNIFSMVFLVAILDFQQISIIYINQHNFKTNYHRETKDTNFSCYFDTTNPGGQVPSKKARTTPSCPLFVCMFAVWLSFILIQEIHNSTKTLHRDSMDVEL